MEQNVKLELLTPGSYWYNETDPEQQCAVLLSEVTMAATRRGEVRMLPVVVVMTTDSEVITINRKKFLEEYAFHSVVPEVESASLNLLQVFSEDAVEQEQEDVNNDESSEEIEAIEEVPSNSYATADDTSTEDNTKHITFSINNVDPQKVEPLVSPEHMSQLFANMHTTPILEKNARGEVVSIGTQTVMSFRRTDQRLPQILDAVFNPKSLTNVYDTLTIGETTVKWNTLLSINSLVLLSAEFVTVHVIDQDIPKVSGVFGDAIEAASTVSELKQSEQPAQPVQEEPVQPEVELELGEPQVTATLGEMMSTEPKVVKVDPGTVKPK